MEVLAGVVGIFGPEALEESVWAPKKAKRFYLSVKGFAQKIPLQLHPYNYTSFIYIIGMEYMFWKVFNYTMPTSKKSSKQNLILLPFRRELTVRPCIWRVRVASLHPAR